MQDFPLVLVHWNDAWADSHDWASAEEVGVAHQVLKMVTVGWMLADNEKGISLFCEKSVEDGRFRGRTFIPRPMITKVEPVLVKKVTKKKKEAPHVDVSPRNAPEV